MEKKQCMVVFGEEGSRIVVDAGTTVLQAQILAGKTPNALCGGKGTCGKCKVKIDGEIVLACQTVVEQDLYVESMDKKTEESQILMTKTGRNVVFAPAKMPEGLKHPLLGAVDIGTTTVVAYLIDGENGKLLGMKSMLNPQRKYGADVVSRCSYALENGKEALSEPIRAAVNTLMAELAESQGMARDHIVRIMIVGNTGMHHLFLELPTEKLVLAPYVPYQKEACVKKASEYGIAIHPQGEVLWLPNIGGFVGADTVGCLVATAMEEQSAMTLMVDIGTNGEMVLGNKDGLMACSTAAGPAFEGARITCGMRGSAGAIDKVWLENNEIRYHVIGETEPTGICGSGLLDAAAALLKTGLLEESGRLEETYYFTEQVFLNQKDIRELQLAKAAIAAGIKILCMRKQIEVTDIDRVLLAGAFGNYLNPDSACAIRLLPEELKEKIIQVGNAAGEGAQIAVMSDKEFEKAKKTAAETCFLELAMDPDFQDVYVDELSFGEEEE